MRALLVIAALLSAPLARARCTGPSELAVSNWPEGRRMPPRLRPRPVPGLAAGLSVLPGLGHLYLCDWQGTAVGIGVPVGLFVSAAIVTTDASFLPGGLHDEPLVTPLVYGIQNSWFYGIYDSWRLARLARWGGQPARHLPVDPSPVSRHLAAPFRKDSLTDPWVLGAFAFGLTVSAASTLAADPHGYPVWSRDTVPWFGDQVSLAPGLLLGELMWSGIFFGVGPGEEGLFRGVVQTTAVEALGPVAGIPTASVLFGAAHYDPNLDTQANLTRVAYTGALGLGLGWLANRDGYELRRPIAAHFWYDFGVGTAAFLLAPDEMPWSWSTGGTF